MKRLKQNLALCLALAMLLTLAACGRKTEVPVQPEAPSPEAAAPAPEAGVMQEPEEPAVTVRAAALKGPTAMGLVNLIGQFGVSPAPQEEPLVELRTENGGAYAFTLAASADEVTPLLIKGELDMACVPANLASVLYNRTEGQVVTLGINTLGVLYIVDRSGSVQSFADLRGKTVVASGKGSVPEYGFRYLLTENGLDPDGDLNIEWKSEHSECVAALASGAADIALLPQPFVTVAQSRLADLRIALDLTAEWDALDTDSAMITGVVVARRAFVEEYPAAAAAFLKDYAASVQWVNTHPAEAAQYIGEYGIVDAAVAEKALPYCNIVCITGEEMKDKLSGYLRVLAEQAPEAVGGTLPADDFYYGA